MLSPVYICLCSPAWDLLEPPEPTDSQAEPGRPLSWVFPCTCMEAGPQALFSTTDPSLNWLPAFWCLRNCRQRGCTSQGRAFAGAMERGEGAGGAQNTPTGTPAGVAVCLWTVMAATISRPIDQAPSPGASVLTHCIYLCNHMLLPPFSPGLPARRLLAHQPNPVKPAHSCAPGPGEP